MWNGNIGTLIAKPASSSRKIKTCGLLQKSTCCPLAQFKAAQALVSSGIEKVSTLSGENTGNAPPPAR